MSFSVVGSVNHLISEYRRFLLSTYRLADKKLRDQFEDHIKAADVLAKGPYLTLANDFARGHTLKQLHFRKSPRIHVVNSIKNQFPTASFRL